MEDMSGGEIVGSMHNTHSMAEVMERVIPLVVFEH